MSFLSNEVDKLKNVTRKNMTKNLVNILSAALVESIVEADNQKIVNHIAFDLISLDSSSLNALKCHFQVRLFFDISFPQDRETIIELTDRVSCIVPINLISSKKDSDLFNYCCNIDNLLRDKAPFEKLGVYFPFSYVVCDEDKICDGFNSNKISKAWGVDSPEEKFIWKMQENFLKKKEVLFDYHVNDGANYQSDLHDIHPAGSLSNLLRVKLYEESNLRYISLLGKYSHCEKKLESMLNVISQPVKFSKNLPYWRDVALNLYLLSNAQSSDKLSQEVLVRSIYNMSKDKEVPENSSSWEKIKAKSIDESVFNVHQHLNDCCITINTPQFMQKYLHWEGKEDAYKRLFMLGFTNFSIDMVINPWNKFVKKELELLLKPLNIINVSEIEWVSNYVNGFPDASMTVSFTSCKDNHSEVIKNFLDYSLLEAKKYRTPGNMSFSEDDVQEVKFRNVVNSMFTKYIISESFKNIYKSNEDFQDIESENLSSNSNSSRSFKI